MAGNNESNINETTSVDNCDDSNIMNNVEVHSTPNVSQENKTKINVDETNSTDDSGIQVTPKLSRERDVYKRQVIYTRLMLLICILRICVTRYVTVY